MALSFPTTPSNGDTYTYSGRTWLYNGSGWQSYESYGQVLAVAIPVISLVETEIAESPSNFDFLANNGWTRLDYV